MTLEERELYIREKEEQRIAELQRKREEKMAEQQKLREERNTQRDVEREAARQARLTQQALERVRCQIDESLGIRHILSFYSSGDMTAIPDFCKYPSLSCNEICWQLFSLPKYCPHLPSC